MSATDHRHAPEPDPQPGGGHPRPAPHAPTVAVGVVGLAVAAAVLLALVAHRYVEPSRLAPWVVLGVGVVLVVASLPAVIDSR